MEQPGVTALAVVAGARPLGVESALFERMLLGWRRQPGLPKIMSTRGAKCAL